MTIAELGSIGEFVSSIVVVITMIYLAIQLRQNTAAMRMGAEQERSQWWYAFNREMALDGAILEIFHQGLQDASQLSDQERRQFIWYVAALFYRLAGFHKQWLRGQLSDDSWQPSEYLIREFLNHESVDRWWRSGFFLGSDDFKQYVESVRASISPAEWQYLDIARVFDRDGNDDE